jgi:serine phosphatase RsbU (regulator of sigma subunit)/CHASE2 domain-containing sensor protein
VSGHGENLRLQEKVREQSKLIVNEKGQRRHQVKNIKTNAILFAIILFAVLLLENLSLLDTFEYLWLDKLSAIRYALFGKSFAFTGENNSPVTIVTIPSHSERQKKYGEPGQMKKAYVRALNLLRRQEAKVIALNLLTASSEMEGIKPSDISAGNGKSPIILPHAFIRTGKNMTLIGTPDPNLKKLAASLGLVEVDSNVKMRWIPMYETIDRDIYRHFLTDILISYYDISQKDFKVKWTPMGKVLELGRDKKVLLQRKNYFFINYYMPTISGLSPRTPRYFSVYSMDQLLDNTIPLNEIKDRIIIIGSIDPVDRYFHLTPLGFISGSEIYAQALYSMIAGPPLRMMPAVIYSLFIFFIGIGCFVIFIHNRTKRNPWMFIIVSAAYLLLTMLSFFAVSLYICIIPFYLLLAGILILRIYVSQEEQQEQLDKHLEAFKVIVEKSLEQSNLPDWGNSLLTLICQPFKIARGVLILLRDDKIGSEGREYFHYPAVENPKSVLFEEEIETMILTRKPVLSPSSLMVPLIQGSNSAPFGVLKLQKKNFTNLELQMMMVLSHFAFISMYNMRLMQKVKSSERLQLEAELAARIQKALLAEKAPSVRGVSIAARCIPASEVGGDYFDFITSHENTVGIAVGDVTGHGMGAALIMGLLRSVLRGQTTQGMAPGDVVSSINNVMYSDFISFEKMASLFYCTYSIVDKTLTFTNAGHTPPLLVRSNELHARPLRGKGPILGFRSNIKYKEFKIKIYPGDIIAYMTDGIVEAENAQKEFFGQEKVEKIVNDNMDNSAEEILDQIFKQVDEFTEGCPQRDDMTLIIMKA